MYDRDMEYSYAISHSIHEQTLAEADRLGYGDEIESLEEHGYCPELDR